MWGWGPFPPIQREGCWSGFPEKCCEDCREQCRKKVECRKECWDQSRCLCNKGVRQCSRRSSKHSTFSRHCSQSSHPCHLRPVTIKPVGRIFEISDSNPIWRKCRKCGRPLSPYKNKGLRRLLRAKKRKMRKMRTRNAENAENAADGL